MIAKNKVVPFITIGGLVLLGCLAAPKPQKLTQRTQMSDYELMRASMKTYNGRQTASQRHK